MKITLTAIALTLMLTPLFGFDLRDNSPLLTIGDKIEAKKTEQTIRTIVSKDRCRLRCLVRVKKISKKATQSIISELSLINKSKKPQKMKYLKSLLSEEKEFDLYDLTYEIIGDKNLREQFLQELNRSFRENPQFPKVTTIVSDMDDTIFPSLKDKVKYTIFDQLATLEESKKRLVPYVGVFELYRKLLQGSPNLIILSARPDDLNLIKDVTYSTFNSLNSSARLSKPLFVFSEKIANTNSEMSRAKQENMDKVRQLFPEDKFIFFGDSGQGDYEFFKSQYSKMEFAFVHDLKEGNSLNIDSRKEDKIFFVQDYLETAQILYGKHYLSLQELNEMKQLF